jgi:1-deoxy-D-xylulose-5-phosphate reductoisomerase
VRHVAVLGSTGSIGRQTLAVCARHSQHLRVTALAAGGDLDALCLQARAARPLVVALERPADPERAHRLLADAAPGAAIELGEGAAERLVRRSDADTVVNGIVGAAGLGPTLAALERGARLALANKETLVVGADLVQRARREGGGELLPIDSEHSAALQCLGGRPALEVRTLTLTASGGALRDHPDWRRATRDEVLAHPVWSMGRRITVDSALLVNKGLELIEARALFGLEWSQLDAVLHPEARVHAWVTFRDGGAVLQAAAPDMALPIQLALSWPERWDLGLEALEPRDLEALTFRPIAPGDYPAFDVVVAAGRAGGTAPCAVNAADEVAVEAFLDGTLPIAGVPEVLARVLDAHDAAPVESREQLAEVDAWARDEARRLIRAAVPRVAGHA